jgi:hypothetical protein
MGVAIRGIVHPFLSAAGLGAANYVRLAAVRPRKIVRRREEFSIALTECGAPPSR